MKALFESVRVDLNSPDGNAFALIGIVSKCLKQAGFDKKYIEDVVFDMMSAGYEHLCEVASNYVELYNSEYEYF